MLRNPHTPQRHHSHKAPAHNCLLCHCCFAAHVWPLQTACSDDPACTYITPENDPLASTDMCDILQRVVRSNITAPAPVSINTTAAPSTDNLRNATKLCVLLGLCTDGWDIYGCRGHQHSCLNFTLPIVAGMPNPMPTGTEAALSALVTACRRQAVAPPPSPTGGYWDSYTKGRKLAQGAGAGELLWDLSGVRKACTLMGT